MLRDKYRMTAKRRLLAVVRQMLWRKPPRNQFTGMADHFRHTVFTQISFFTRTQAEAHAKIRMRQGIENSIDIAHGTWLRVACDTATNL
jgi:hypothetical protein